MGPPHYKTILSFVGGFRGMVEPVTWNRRKRRTACWHVKDRWDSPGSSRLCFSSAFSLLRVCFHITSFPFNGNNRRSSFTPLIAGQEEWASRTISSQRWCKTSSNRASRRVHQNAAPSRRLFLSSITRFSLWRWRNFSPHSAKSSGARNLTEALSLSLLPGFRVCCCATKTWNLSFGRGQRSTLVTWAASGGASWGRGSWRDYEWTATTPPSAILPGKQLQSALEVPFFPCFLFLVASLTSSSRRRLRVRGRWSRGEEDNPGRGFQVPVWAGEADDDLRAAIERASVDLRRGGDETADDNPATVRGGAGVDERERSTCSAMAEYCLREV